MAPEITWMIVGTTIIASLLVRAYWKFRFDRILRRQELREKFAATRRAAVQLLHDRQLEPNSVSFAALYLISSTLVRRSSSYGAFSTEIIKSLSGSALRSRSPYLETLHGEMKSWTPDVREVWDSFAEDVFLMVGTSIWSIRALIRLEQYFPVIGALKILVSAVEALFTRIDRDGALPIGIDVLRTSRQTREWARLAAAA